MIAVAVGLALLTLAVPRAASAAGVVYSGALQFASGDYIFADRTNSVYLINGLFVSSGPVRVSASIPIIYQNTSLVSSSGPGMMPAGDRGQDGSAAPAHGGGHATGVSGFHDVGVGDPLLRADWEALREPGVAVAAVAKPPLASVEKGFGTGEWDYGAGLSLAHLVRRTFLSASAIYWVMGDPAEVDLHNAVAYSVGVGRPLARGRFSALVSLAGYTRVLEGVDPFRQIAVSLGYVPASGRSLSAAVTFGLSQSAPDVGLSLGWSVAL
jgi:hypothetical protein